MSGIRQASKYTPSVKKTRTLSSYYERRNERKSLEKSVDFIEIGQEQPLRTVKDMYYNHCRAASFVGAVPEGPYSGFKKR